MKKIFLTVWAAMCTVWASIAGTCLAFAEEHTTKAAQQVLFTMDVFKTVCLVIVITAVALFVVFYIAKAVLKKLHVAPDEKEEGKESEKD